ncbi:Dedicator of cytokinesis protein 1 [Chelonia mydas]|uniref:Dedicator of cytokinesis protein 1 n=1 Tax=Chelonia mydas TaxID=8469 RepID=M7CLW7_CHEMY|nr:Dedicator of cytokinesis protein 1 [Chelonia mydas]
MGAAGSGGPYVPWPTPLPAAPVGLEQQTAATGSRDRPNLRTQQGNFVASMTAILRQMEDYHYAHLIKTFGKMRSDVVHRSKGGSWAILTSALLLAATLPSELGSQPAAGALQLHSSEGSAASSSNTWTDSNPVSTLGLHLDSDNDTDLAYLVTLTSLL